VLHPRRLLHPRQRLNEALWYLRYPALIAIWCYRRSRRLLLAGRLEYSQALRGIGRILTGIDISPSARIGDRLIISHGQGVVIGGATIGDDCWILQNVTIGLAGRGIDDLDDAHASFPTLGDRVTVYAGAVLVGAITVGDDAVIAANAVVTEDVPAGATVGGIPARVLKDS
jgi:serine O-acetyltransferase